MTPTSVTDTSALPTPSEREAMMSLLIDEDPTIHQTIRDKFLSYGEKARDLLKPYALSQDPLLRTRANEILSVLRQRKFDTDFVAYCLTHKEKIDLERGIFLLAQTQYPDINPDGYKALLDTYAMDLLEIIDFGGTEESILTTVNDYLFGKLGYHGNEDDYYDPDNSYINQVIDCRAGNPISLCTLYLLVAKRLHLPVVGIGMPGHFICRFQSNTTEIFIDAFHGGKLLTRKDCVTLLKNSGVDFNQKYLSPAQPIQMLRRICANLFHVYQQKGQPREAARFNRYLAAMRNSFF